MLDLLDRTYGDVQLSGANTKIERGALEGIIQHLIEKLPGNDESWFPEFKNETFEIRPYYWGDCNCDAEIDCACHCPASLPNFKHYRTGLEIDWYKYPFRRSYANTTLINDVQWFAQICKECENSI